MRERETAERNRGRDRSDPTLRPRVQGVSDVPRDVERRAGSAAGPVPCPLRCTLPPAQPFPRPHRARSVLPVSSRAPAGPRRQHHALVSSPQTRTPGSRGSGQRVSDARAPAQLPSPRAGLRSTGRRAILTQARKGDGGVVLGAGLLGAVRVWAEAGGCLPAVVRLLLLRGHGQAALPGRPAGGLPWRFRGPPAQDGLNGEAGDAAGRRTPLARIFLAAHPGFIRNRRKPRTPFRDDLSGRWCRQAGGGEGRGGESRGGGGEAGEASPPCGGHAGTGRLRGGPRRPGSGCARRAPARMPLLRPPAPRVSGCAEVARPHLHRGSRDLANRSAAERPGNFQTAEAGKAAPVLAGALGAGPASAVSDPGRRREQHKLHPRSLTPSRL